ncbi:unnamed protein product [Lepidochelys kempii]
MSLPQAPGRMPGQRQPPPPACCLFISPAHHLRHHQQRPGALSHHDKEARYPMPPSAHLAPHGDLRAGVGDGGGALGHCGGLQNVRKGRFLLSIRGCCPGSGGEGPGGGGVFVPLEPLEDLGVCLVLTSVPPFLPSAALLPALSTLGKPVSVISPLPLGCKDPTLRHIFSFRRQVQLLPPSAARDGVALEGSFLVPHQGAHYHVYFSMGEAWCYLCRASGHGRRDCPLAQQGGAPGIPVTQQDIGPIIANAPGRLVPEPAPPLLWPTATPAQAQGAPPLQRPDKRESPALAAANLVGSMEEGVAEIPPGMGESLPQGESSLPYAAPPSRFPQALSHRLYPLTRPLLTSPQMMPWRAGL